MADSGSEFQSLMELGKRMEVVWRILEFLESGLVLDSHYFYLELNRVLGDLISSILFLAHNLYIFVFNKSVMQIAFFYKN